MSNHTKLFYKVVARLRISKPDYLAINVIAKRFRVSLLRAFRVRQELEEAGIIRKIDPEKEKSNIDWGMVKKVRVPKLISKAVKEMKPERVYP